MSGPEKEKVLDLITKLIERGECGCPSTYGLPEVVKCADNEANCEHCWSWAKEAIAS